jgi:hypothetical protein
MNLLNFTQSDKKSFIVCIVAWIIVFLTMYALGNLLTFLPDNWFHFLDHLTSWITLFMIASCGIMSAVSLFKTNRKLALYTVLSCSCLFTCYFGYVTVQWGDKHPHLSANGYNLGTSLVVLAIYLISNFYCKSFYRNVNGKPR